MQASAADTGIIAIDQQAQAIAAIQEPLKRHLRSDCSLPNTQQAMSAYSSSHSPGEKSPTACIRQSGAFWFRMPAQQSRL